MAKSLRSKGKRAFRRAKREDPSSDYHRVHKHRILRAGDRMARGNKAKVEVTDRLVRFSHVANLTGKRLVSTIDAELQRGAPVVDGSLDDPMIAAKTTTIAGALNGGLEGSEVRSEEEVMDTPEMEVEDDDRSHRPISTSAPRANRRETWREARGCKQVFPKRTKANKTTFDGRKKFAPAHGRSKSAVLKRK